MVIPLLIVGGMLMIRALSDARVGGFSSPPPWLARCSFTFSSSASEYKPSSCSRALGNYCRHVASPRQSLNDDFCTFPLVGELPARNVSGIRRRINSSHVRLYRHIPRGTIAERCSSPATRRLVDHKTSLMVRGDAHVPRIDRPHSW